MDAIEIMNNEEAMEAAAEIVAKGGSKTKVLKVLAKLGITGVVAIITYKLVKLILAKRRAKKELDAADADYIYSDEDDLDDEDVDDEE